MSRLSLPHRARKDHLPLWIGQVQRFLELIPSGHLRLRSLYFTIGVQFGGTVPLGLMNFSRPIHHVSVTLIGAVCDSDSEMFGTWTAVDASSYVTVVTKPRNWPSTSG